MKPDTSTERPQMPKGLKAAGVIAALIAVGVVAAGTISRSSQEASAQQWSDSSAIPTVRLIAAKGSGSTDQLELPGTMEAWNTARLFPRVNGYVKSWSHDIGNKVAAGTALGLVDTPELDEQIGQARADLQSARASASLARSTASRWNDLLSTHSVSQQEADEKNGDLSVKNAAVAGAQAALNRLLAMREYATVRAPFTGVITLRNAQIGDLVGPSAGAQQPMFGMADLSRIRLYVSVPQSYAAQIKNGLSASLTVPDYPGKTFNATVLGDSHAINAQSGTLQVELIAANPEELLRPGGYAQVSFDVPGQSHIAVIPSSALIFRSAGTQVATVDAQHHVQMRPVTVGRDMGSTVEIRAGLEPGAQVVDNPPDSLSQGETVQIKAAGHA